MLPPGHRPNLDELLEICATSKRKSYLTSFQDLRIHIFCVNECITVKSTVVGSEEDEDADAPRRGGRKAEVQIGIALPEA